MSRIPATATRRRQRPSPRPAKPKPSPDLIRDARSGQLYVRILAFMSSPMVAGIDGIPTVKFAHASGDYTHQNNARWWLYRERRHHSYERFTRIIEQIEAAVERRGVDAVLA